MKLTKEQLELFQKRVKIKECPVCKTVNVQELSDSEYQLLSLNRTPGSIDLTGSYGTIPFAAITCDNCGHLTLFNLLKLGIVTE